MDIDELVAASEGVEPAEFRRLVFDRLRRLPRMSTGPRDVRRGDRWLPFHFKEVDRAGVVPEAGRTADVG